MSTSDVTADEKVTDREHPAPFSKSVIESIGPWLDRQAAYVAARHQERRPLRILDPFAGIGGIHAFHDDRGDDTVGLELEWEWACQHERTLVGDATAPPFDPGGFDAVVTSPCYGNRFADKYDGRDGSVRRTYRIFLGRMPSDNSAAVMQWGPEYRSFHETVWAAMVDQLNDGGMLLVNISNHLRKWGGEQVEMHVTEWHLSTLLAHGLRLLAAEPVGTPRYGFGANGNARAESEFLLVFRKPEPVEMAAARPVMAPPDRGEQLTLT